MEAADRRRDAAVEPFWLISFQPVKVYMYRTPIKTLNKPKVATTEPNAIADFADEAVSMSGSKPKKKMVSPKTVAAAPSSGAAYPKRVHRSGA